MALVSFSPFGNVAVLVAFPCAQCREPLRVGPVSIPEPDLQADTASRSGREIDDVAECPRCLNLYTVTVEATYAGGTVQVYGLDDGAAVEVTELPFDYDYDHGAERDAVFANTAAFATFEGAIGDIHRLNALDVPDPTLDGLYRRQLYVGVVSCLEAYLSDGLVNTVRDDDDALRRFVEAYRPFHQVKVPVAAVFSTHDAIRSRAVDALLDIVYHRLDVVRPIYESVFDLSFPDVSPLMASLGVRHDIVHRNGKAKDGSEVVVSRRAVADFAFTVSTFVEAVEEQLE